MDTKVSTLYFLVWRRSETGERFHIGNGRGKFTMIFGEKNVDKPIRSAAVEKKGASQTWRVDPKGERMDIRVFSTAPAIKSLLDIEKHPIGYSCRVLP